MLHVYTIVSVLVSLFSLLGVPSKRLNAFDNMMGSLVTAPLGVVLWPVFVAAYVKSRRR